MGPSWHTDLWDTGYANSTFANSAVTTRMSEIVPNSSERTAGNPENPEMSPSWSLSFHSSIGTPVTIPKPPPLAEKIIFVAFSHEAVRWSEEHSIQRRYSMFELQSASAFWLKIII